MCRIVKEKKWSKEDGSFFLFLSKGGGGKWLGHELATNIISPAARKMAKRARGHKQKSRARTLSPPSLFFFVHTRLPRVSRLCTVITTTLPYTRVRHTGTQRYNKRYYAGISNDLLASATRAKEKGKKNCASGIVIIDGQPYRVAVDNIGRFSWPFLRFLFKPTSRREKRKTTKIGRRFWPHTHGPLLLFF